MPGRPRVPSGPVVGVDIGATKVSAAVVGPDGRVTNHGGRAAHPNEGAESVLAETAGVIRAALDGEDPLAIGVGVAAQVDRAEGIVIHAPNLRWRSFPLAERLRAEFRCPVAVVNDARAATLGEWRHGAGVGVLNLLTVWVGTGIGGSAVIDGRLVDGASNAFGEIGHIVVRAGGRRCHCPGQGCLEAYASGWAIAERAQERVRTEAKRARRLVARAGSIDSIDAKAVGDLSHEGDPLCSELMAETATYLSEGVAGIVNAFNPARLILGGGVIEGSPELIESIRTRVRTHCQPPAADAVEVVRAALGHDAIIVGAAEFARERAVKA